MRRVCMERASFDSGNCLLKKGGGEGGQGEYLELLEIWEFKIETGTGGIGTRTATASLLIGPGESTKRWGGGWEYVLEKTT